MRTIRRSTTRSPRPVRKGGFTLIELVISLVISSVVVLAVFQVMRWQGQFTRYQTSREEVQQNARVALEMLSAELRGVAWDGINVGTTNAVTFRSPRAWGISCGIVSGRRVAILFPNEAGSMLRDGTEFVSFNPGGGTTWPGVQVSDITSQGTNLSDARVRCTAQLGTNAAAMATLRPRLMEFPIGASPAVGARVYTFDSVTYDVGTAPGLNGSWIRRRPATGGALQALAGPVPTAGPTPGLRLVYFDANMDPNPPTLGAVRAVRVVVATNSTARFGGAAQHQIDSTLVYLRNR